MASIEFGDCQAQTNEEGECLISWGSDNLLYKQICCSPPQKLSLFHSTVRNLVSQNYWFPNHLFPFTFNGHDNPIVMVKYLKPEPLSKINSNWYFKKVSLPGVSKSESLYASVDFKKSILSVVKTVVAFYHSFQFRPILDVRHMYVGADNNIVFTRYELRGKNQDWAYETTEMSQLFNMIGKNKAKYSKTIREELKALGGWLRATTHQHLLGNINLIFENVFFWSVDMRIMFIIELHDLLEHGVVSIFPTCEDAFKCPGDPSPTDFRTMIRRSNINVLKELLKACKDDYEEKLKAWSCGRRVAPPSIMRSSTLGTNRKDVLEQGLTFVRDSYRHAFKNASVSTPLEDIQQSFQYVFPIHMIEFGKVQNSLSFNVVDGVHALLSAPPSTMLFAFSRGIRGGPVAR